MKKKVTKAELEELCAQLEIRNKTQMKEIRELRRELRQERREPTVNRLRREVFEVTVPLPVDVSYKDGHGPSRDRIEKAERRAERAVGRCTGHRGTRATCEVRGDYDTFKHAIRFVYLVDYREGDAEEPCDAASS